MPEDLIILCREKTQPCDLNAARIARHMGVPFSFCAISKGGALPGVLLDATRHRKPVLVAGCDALQCLADLSGGKWPDVLKNVKALLVHGCQPAAGRDELLAKLSGGAVRAVKAGQQAVHRISVAADSRDFAHQLAGLEFDVTGKSADVAFVLADNATAVRKIICGDGDPFLIELNAGGVSIVLSGAGEIADLDLPVTGKFSLLDEFPRLAPMMMFIRKFFGEQAWHSETAWASFIIDDPLLRAKYGFVDYSELLDAMQRSRFSTCIAFIPWNYRRSDPAVAGMFKSHPDRLSICVHGCDHTRGEYCIKDEAALRQISADALWRMEQHESLSSVPFDPVMVFPQGLFSRAAMKVLGETGFMAAINTSPFPVDADSTSLTLSDLLEPAITKYSNFPLFIRRYPKNVAEFAFDLFLGKPLLMVEHHQYFRDGTKELESFIAKANALDSNLRWSHPAAICSQTCLQRRTGENSLGVRFFTDQFQLTNNTGKNCACTLYRNDPDGGKVKSITINGKPSDWTHEDGQLCVTLNLSAQEQAKLVIDRGVAEPAAAKSQAGLLDQTKIFVRRHLSEFRDNFIDKNPAAAWLAKTARKLAAR